MPTTLRDDVRISYNVTPGPADASALYAHPLTVGDTLAILDACAVEQAAVGGLSLGGSPDAGHAANIGQPVLFNPDVTAFLQRHV